MGLFGYNFKLGFNYNLCNNFRMNKPWVLHIYYSYKTLCVITAHKTFTIFLTLVRKRLVYKKTFEMTIVFPKGINYSFE